MTFLPIVERELRVAARRHSTYWVRLVLALAAVVIGFFLYLAHALTPGPVLAQQIFLGLGIPRFALLPGFRAGARRRIVSVKKSARERLDCYFLTDLKGYDVVLGKLVATSVNAFLMGCWPSCRCWPSRCS